MIQSYQLRFNYLEMRRTAMIKHFVPFTPEQLAWSPGDGKWSMLQVAQHCWMVERLILAQVKQNRKHPEQLRRASLLAGPRLVWASVLMALPLRLKVPEGLPIIPKDPMMLAQLHERWEEHRLEWKACLEEFTPKETSLGVCVHPQMGSMSMGQTVRFLAVHIDHHMMQVIRIIKSPGFPVKEQPEEETKEE